MKKCPYCEESLIEGKIYGDRYQMKWMPNHQKLVLGTWVQGDYIPVGTSGFNLIRPHAKADYCKRCEKIIIDLKIN